jgi:hypothetical protein
MFKVVICFYLASVFLISGVILPLGDFSLLRDIPEMYHNYSKVTSVEELGAIDFIGDYLLHGKDIFGHNEHDKIPAKGCDVQFQHQASPPNVVFNQFPRAILITSETVLAHPLFRPDFYSSDYRNTLFRPPHARLVAQA